MQILHVKTVAEFDEAVVPEGKLLVHPEQSGDGYVWRWKDSNGDTGYLDEGVGTNCVLLSPSAHATGLANICGGYAAKIADYDAGTKTINIVSVDDYDLVEDKYAAGDDIYIVLNMSDDDGVQKHGIDSVTVNYNDTDPTLVDSIDVTLVSELSPPDGSTPPVHDENSNWIGIVAWPDADVTTGAGGQDNVVSGESARSDGSLNMVVGLASHARGVMNMVIGDFCTVAGNNNLVKGQLNDAWGQSNKIDGMFDHVAGSMNQVNGDGHFVDGDMNEIDGNSIFVYGGMNKTVNRVRVQGGEPIETKPMLAFIVGRMCEAGNDNSQTRGYRLKNHAKGATLMGRDAELPNEPENENAFAVGGGEYGNQQIGFITRSRKNVVNPLYDPLLDSDGDGCDDNGEWQYLSEMAFLSKYKGHLLGTTETIADADGDVTLDHDFFSRWKITPVAAATPIADNWLDGDKGELIIYSGGSNISWLSEWKWIGSTPSLGSTGYSLFELRKIDDDIIIEHKITVA